MSQGAEQAGARPGQWDLLLRVHGAAYDLAVRLADSLRERGVRVWVNEPWMMPGRAWLQAIEQQVTRSAQAAILVTDGAPLEWVREEIELAKTHSVGGTSGRAIVISWGHPKPGREHGIDDQCTVFSLSDDPAGWLELIESLAEYVRTNSPRSLCLPGGAEHHRQVVDELGNVFADRESAVNLVLRAGFPRRLLPTFGKPVVFWQSVVDEAQGGAFEGGLASIVATAAEQYPTNPVFTGVARLAEPPAHERRAHGGARPFPGIEQFESRNVHYFFGRDKEVHECLDMLRSAGDTDRRWLQIYGSSGVGKSSLVRAGIVPAIIAGALGGETTRWRYVCLRPGQHPLESLASQFSEAFTGTRMPRRRTLLKKLRADPGALSTALEGALAPGESVLVVVDQLEEALIDADDVERELFDRCVAAIVAERPEVYLITTMRGDFLNQSIDTLRSLTHVLKTHGTPQYPLGLLDHDSLIAAMRGPARLTGLEWDEGLPERIAEDIKGEVGCLPLVAHTLRSMWARATDQRLTLDRYNGLDGVGGALAKDANELINRLDRDEQEAARRIMLRLVKVPRGARSISGPVRRSDVLLAANPDAELAERVLTRLSGGQDPDCRQSLPRLVVVTHEAGGHGEGRVHLMHEALIHQWERLHDWIEMARPVLVRRDWVESMTSDWEAQGRPHHLLAPVRSVIGFFGQRPDDLREFLSARAREYLEHSASAASSAQNQGGSMSKSMNNRDVAAFRHALIGSVQGLTSAADLLMGLVDEHDPQVRNCAALIAESREEIRLWKENQRMLSMHELGTLAVRQSLRPVVEQTVSLYREIFEMREVDVIMDWRAGDDLKLNVDRAELELALSNILDCARKRMTGGNTVMVGVELEGSSIAVWVEYSGSATRDVLEDLRRLEGEVDARDLDLIGSDEFGLVMARRIVTSYGGTMTQEIRQRGARGCVRFSMNLPA